MWKSILVVTRVVILAVRVVTRGAVVFRKQVVKPFNSIVKEFSFQVNGSVPN